MQRDAGAKELRCPAGAEREKGSLFPQLFFFVKAGRYAGGWHVAGLAVSVRCRRKMICACQLRTCELKTRGKPFMTDHGPLTPPEVSFFAEDEPIGIIPLHSLPSIPLVSGCTPVLCPPHRADVPLWYALLLKKHKYCRIAPPIWLNAMRIRHVLEEEIGNQKKFSRGLPFRWLETAEILLAEAEEDLPSAGQGGEGDLRILLRELREARQAKAREGLKTLEGTYV